jgi:hypothetical protein
LPVVGDPNVAGWIDIDIDLQLQATTDVAGGEIGCPSSSGGQFSVRAPHRCAIWSTGEVGPNGVVAIAAAAHGRETPAMAPG